MTWQPVWLERPLLREPPGDRLVDQAVARRDLGSQDAFQAGSPRLADLDNPATLPDADRAAERILKAVNERERIAIETDYDVDGSTSHAILVQALVDGLGCHPDAVGGFVGHRLTDGYGLSQPLCHRIVDWQPDLVITADNGSSDQPRIAQLTEQGVDVIVTDHHEVEGAGPASAYACVNPSRNDSRYPDAAIAGCGVAFLLMWYTARQHDGPVEWPVLRGLVDYVALGTVADCVSLGSSRNNRALVKAGLRLINSCQRPCWTVVLEHLGQDAVAGTLGFQIGPRINARTRLAEPMAAIHYLNATDHAEAANWFAVLDHENEQRKTIEQGMRVNAIDRVDAHGAASHALVHYDPEGHPGVHGIVASRLVARYGLPTVCLSPKADGSGLITGSCRGIPGVSIYQALARVAADQPGLVSAWGGHEGAGGLTLEPSGDPTVFAELFNRAIAGLAPDLRRGPRLWHDGFMDLSQCTVEAVQGVEAYDPWGRGFESPLFVTRARLGSIRAVGSDQRHLKCRLSDPAGTTNIDGIWFFGLEPGQTPADRFEAGQLVDIAGEPAQNRFNGRVSAQILIQDMIEAESDGNGP